MNCVNEYTPAMLWIHDMVDSNDVVSTIDFVMNVSISDAFMVDVGIVFCIIVCMILIIWIYAFAPKKK